MPALLPIQSVTDHLDGLSVCELLCAANGSFRFAEMSIDNDELSASFIAELPSIPDRAFEVEYFKEEHQACLREANIFFFEKLKEEQKEIARRLGDHYPFVFDDDEMIILEEISPIGAMYLWLRLYLISQSKSNYAQFSGDEKTLLDNTFWRVFEYIAALVVSADSIGEPWITAESRSAENLLSILNNLVEAIGHGKLKVKDDLTSTQLTTNDGRVDAVVISRRDGGYRAESTITLVQATIQKSNIRSKVVTAVHVNFFDSFFLNPLVGTKIGALVMPHSYSPLHEDECKNANCSYFDIGAVFRNLGRVVLSNRNAIVAEEAVRQFNKPSDHFDFSE